MKKTLVLNSSEEFDVLLDKHEDNISDFLADRTCIIAETRTINGRTVKGFEASATYYCKSKFTAIRRFIKAVEEAGFIISENDFECAECDENTNCYDDCGYVVCVEGEEGCWNITFMCFQDKVTEETAETTETEENKALVKLKADCIKKAVENYKQDIEKTIQGLYKKTRTGIKTVIVDSHKMFEYYINKGYDFYCTPNFADILKHTDPEFWDKFKNS